MAVKKLMGTETEYGIVGGSATSVVDAYKNMRRLKDHENNERTNDSIIKGEVDIGGHIGGDYGTLEEQIKDAEEKGVHTIPEYFGENYYPWGLNKSYYNYYNYDSDSVLPNGARYYVDMGHPEMSTPLTENPRDLVIFDKAGERIVLESANLVSGVKIYKNNSDGSGNSFGCHENYLMQRLSEEEFESKLVPALLPFLVTRQIYAGSGKIGIEEERGWLYSSYYSKYTHKKNTMAGYESKKESAIEIIEGLARYFVDIPEFSEVQRLLQRMFELRKQKGDLRVYQISQRADFFAKIMGLGTTSDRPIINTRDEPHADKSKYMRLHVICGDANMSEVATYLKAGTTALVLNLIEDGLAPRINIAKPVSQIKKISLDQSRKWNVELENGKTMPAVEIQRLYLKAAKDAYKGRDMITDDILQRWEYTLDMLEKDPMKLSTTIDWVIKLNLLTKIMDSKGLTLDDNLIKNAALQYHDIDPSTGLFYFLQKKGAVERIVTDDEIINAVSNPPENTRDYLRGKIVGLKCVSSMDWGSFDVKCGADTYEVKIDEPTSGTKAQLEGKLKADMTGEELVEVLKNIPGISVSKREYLYHTQSSGSLKRDKKKKKKPLFRDSDFSGGD